MERAVDRLAVPDRRDASRTSAAHRGWWLPGDGQCPGADGEDAQFPGQFRLGYRWTQPGQAPQQRGEGRLKLQPAQRRAEAVVDAVAEREVWGVRGAGHVQPVRLGEQRLVPVGGV